MKGTRPMYIEHCKTLFQMCTYQIDGNKKIRIDWNTLWFIEHKSTW